MDKIERPDLSNMDTQEIAQMLIICGASDEESDRQFAKFCADELKRRKPTTYTPPMAPASTRGVK